MFPLSVCPYMYFSQAFGVATGFATQALSPLQLPLCLKTTEKSLNVISGMKFTHAQGETHTFSPAAQLMTYSL